MSDVVGMRLVDELHPPRPPRQAHPKGGLRLLSQLARAGSTGEGRQRFRLEALEVLRGAVPFEFGFIAAPPSERSFLAVLGASPAMIRLLSRHARASWAELRDLRPRAEGGVLQLPGTPTESPMLRLLQVDRPVSSLCIGWFSDNGAAVVLGRDLDPIFRGPELELLRLALPVLTLADSHAADLADSLGARLSPREEEIFAYLQRGYSNRQIGLVLGTSPLTVRNQLARLFRKVGVASRAELVGLAGGWARPPRSDVPS